MQLGSPVTTSEAAASVAPSAAAKRFSLAGAVDTASDLTARYRHQRTSIDELPALGAWSSSLLALRGLPWRPRGTDLSRLADVPPSPSDIIPE